MKETSFGITLMAFYSENFGEDKSLKLNVSVLKIVDQYDRDSKSFEIGGKRIQLTVEDVAFTFDLPINRANFIINKICTLKNMGVIKHYFTNVKKIAKISTEEALDDLLIKKEK